MGGETLEGVRAEVLASLEAPPELFDHLGELLGGLDFLGTDPTHVVGLLRAAGVAAGARALDAGCGTGVVSVALAAELGLIVEGVDAYPPFVERARARALARGVAPTCTFRCDDLRIALRKRECFDVALLGAVGPVLGDLATTVEQIRCVVRPDGFILIDDAFRSDKAEAEGVPNLKEARAALTSCGDALLAELVPPVAALRAVNLVVTEEITVRALALIRRRPELGPALLTYVRRQREECARLESTLVPALWLLRRAR